MAWIMLRGAWDDFGIWDDTDVWRDGPTIIQRGVEVIHPHFGKISNAATWEERVALFDSETGDVVDLSEVDSIEITIRDPFTLTEILSGDIDDGTIFILTDDASFGWSFTDDQMGTLDPKTYEVGVLVTVGEEVGQIILGQVSVLRGL